MGDCSDSAEVLGWNTLAAVAAHAACALMASIGDATVDDAAPDVGVDAMVAVCEAPEGGNTVTACTAHRDYEVVPA